MSDTEGRCKHCGKVVRYVDYFQDHLLDAHGIEVHGWRDTVSHLEEDTSVEDIDLL